MNINLKLVENNLQITPNNFLGIIDCYLGKVLVVCDSAQNNHNINKLLLKTIQDYFKKQNTNSIILPYDILFGALDSANHQITEYNAQYNTQECCSCSLVLIHENELWLAHIGDTRIYLVRDGEANLLTTDHTSTEELLNKGEINSEEAKFHPNKHALSKALGLNTALQIDYNSEPLELFEKDTIIICNKNVYENITEKDIATIHSKPLDNIIKKFTSSSTLLIAATLSKKPIVESVKSAASNPIQNAEPIDTSDEAISVSKPFSKAWIIGLVALIVGGLGYVIYKTVKKPSGNELAVVAQTDSIPTPIDTTVKSQFQSSPFEEDSTEAAIPVIEETEKPKTEPVKDKPKVKEENIAPKSEIKKPEQKQIQKAKPEIKPTSKSGVVSHELKPGENLYTLAKKYNTTVEAIIKKNNIQNPAKMKDGLVLSIPTGQQQETSNKANLKTATKAEIKEKKIVKPKGTQTYTVKSGATLYSIAKKYNTTPEELMKLNKMKNSNLKENQTLIVPGK